MVMILILALPVIWILRLLDIDTGAETDTGTDNDTDTDTDNDTYTDPTTDGY